MGRPDQPPSRAVQSWVGELMAWRRMIDGSSIEVWEDEGVQHHTAVLIARMMDRAGLTTDDLPAPAQGADACDVVKLPTAG